MSHTGATLNKHLIRFYKSITLFLFLLLPEKVTRTFLELSLVALITNTRGACTPEHCFDVEKLTQLLKNEAWLDLMDLPNYTLTWFWTEESLQEVIEVRRQRKELRALLADDELTRKNLNTITSELLERLPYLMKLKLRLNDKRKRLEIRHAIVSLLNQGLTPAH